jgi:hypothetical protein
MITKTRMPTLSRISTDISLSEKNEISPSERDVRTNFRVFYVEDQQNRFYPLTTHVSVMAGGVSNLECGIKVP